MNDHKKALGLVESALSTPKPTFITIHRPRIIEVLPGVGFPLVVLGDHMYIIIPVLR